MRVRNSLKVNFITMRFELVTIYQFLNFYISSLSGQCNDNSKAILFKQNTNWNGDLYAFNLVNIRQSNMNMHLNIEMIMHCNKASIDYLERAERIYPAMQRRFVDKSAFLDAYKFMKIQKLLAVCIKRFQITLIRTTWCCSSEFFIQRKQPRQSRSLLLIIMCGWIISSSC